MLFFGIPTKCPMDAGSFCQNDIKKSVMPSTRRLLGLMIGDVFVEAKIEHNDNVRFN